MVIISVISKIRRTVPAEAPRAAINAFKLTSKGNLALVEADEVNLQRTAQIHPHLQYQYSLTKPLSGPFLYATFQPELTVLWLHVKGGYDFGLGKAWAAICTDELRCSLKNVKLTIGGADEWSYHLCAGLTYLWGFTGLDHVTIDIFDHVKNPEETLTDFFRMTDHHVCDFFDALGEDEYGERISPQPRGPLVEVVSSPSKQKLARTLQSGWEHLPQVCSDDCPFLKKPEDS